MCVCIYICVLMWKGMGVFMCVRMYTCVYMGGCICACVCVYVSVCACLYVKSSSPLDNLISISLSFWSHLH